MWENHPSIINLQSRGIPMRLDTPCAADYKSYIRSPSKGVTMKIELSEVKTIGAGWLDDWIDGWLGKDWMVG